MQSRSVNMSGCVQWRDPPPPSCQQSPPRLSRGQCAFSRIDACVQTPGDMASVSVHAGSFLRSVASPFHCFVTTSVRFRHHVTDLNNNAPQRLPMRQVVCCYCCAMSQLGIRSRSAFQAGSYFVAFLAVLHDPVAGSHRREFNTCVNHEIYVLTCKIP